ncbi:ATP-binding cassette domain-containing protein [Nocardioides aquiterrae]|uniref:ATP-binding cassette domain-containing protein n=1 Tax=Nocardioides aquiterrae TaxID=203799 RepID=A0ABP4F8J2_9ACTN
MTVTTPPTPVLDVVGVTKTYGHVQALRGVDLQVRPGEVHALVGDNGAGKSTLMKIIAGAVSPTAGTVSVRGQAVSFSSPSEAQAAGIETVYQDLALAPTLTPGENLYLGREIPRKGLLGRLGFIDRGAMNRSAKDQLTSLGASVQSLSNEVGSLSGGQKQAVAVARASLWGSALIMLDEPTAALGVSQTEQVLRLVERLRDERGLAVLLISHSMPDVFRVADRVTVLRLGRTVLTAETSSLSTNDLIAAMTGMTAGLAPASQGGAA